MHERDGPWYFTEHSLLRDENRVDKIGRSEWADWSPSGDLLFSMDGKLYRLPSNQVGLPDLENASMIADFSVLQFENRMAPARYLRWPAA